MSYSIVFLLLFKALMLSIGALCVVLALRRIAASKQNIAAVVALLALLIAPMLAYQMPSKTIVAPAPVVRTLAYVGGEGDVQVIKHVSPSVANVVPNQNLDLRPIILGVWAFGTLFFLVRIALGFCIVAKWRRSARTAGQDNIFIGEFVSVPMSAWWGKSFILLPSESAVWDEVTRQRVIAHESAHIQRKDLLWNLIGQIACATYWPFPSVWAIRRVARDSAERACDDRVLHSGAVASDYAQDLITIARDLRMTPTVALPMAHKAEIGKRIAHILDNKVSRARASFSAFALTGAGAMLFSIPMAAVAFVALPQTGGNQTFSLATPGSKPGAPENNFVGTMSDGRQVILVQIQHKGKNGLEVWKPDGTSISKPQDYGKNWWLSQSDHIEMVFKFQTDNVDDRLSAMAQPGQTFPGENNARLYAGGSAEPADDSGWRTAIAMAGLNNGAASPGTARNSFCFTYGSNQYQSLCTLRPNASGKVAISSQDKDSSVSGLKFLPADAKQVADTDKNGTVILANGQLKMRTASGWGVEMLISGHSPNELNCVAYDKAGKAHRPLVSFPIYENNTEEKRKMHVLVELPLGDVDRVEVQVREGQAVDFNHVVVRPDLLHK